MRRVLLACVAVGLVALLAGCGTVVPDVKGMTAAQAEKSVTSAGFAVGRINYDEQATGAIGAVVAQDPAAGASASRDALVLLTVAGPKPVVTPNLLGLDKAGSTAAVAAVGLAVGQVSESYDTSAAAGTVASQTPAPGVEVQRGSGVSLVISKGPEPIAVPSVDGKAEAAAKQLLVAAGFRVKVITAASDAKKGTVISQKPDGGKSQPGSTVTISISSGYVRVIDARSLGESQLAAVAASRAGQSGNVRVQSAYRTSDVLVMFMTDGRTGLLSATLFRFSGGSWRWTDVHTAEMYLNAETRLKFISWFRSKHPDVPVKLIETAWAKQMDLGN